jgi:3-methyladenine DNA glycosylase AlkC
MPEALKTFFSPALVRRLAADLARVDSSFAEAAFVRDATRGLSDLELLARGRHIAGALARHLPSDYRAAIGILLKSLGPEHATDELVGAGMAPFFYLPHVTFVAERGLDHFDESMRAQYELTKRFSAESSIRPYIARDPERTLGVLTRWANDPNAHVRRLVSEGTRLRLPWAARVRWLDEHPERVLALLERLKDDPASLVRRSVANSLNDLGKVHPALLIRTSRRWLAGASARRRALVEHALRSAVRRGDAAALRLLGYGRAPSVAVDEVRMTPRRVAIGGRVAIACVVRNTSGAAQNLLLDLVVHFVKRHGRATPKVFKLKRLRIAPGGRAPLRARISLAVHTTRVPHPGRHAVELVVNGRRYALGSFVVGRASGGSTSR